ncbi:hypothetical protein [Nonomuraea sp. NPDC048916]|uniref:hypothetical protein n=1 Tax=Nonomuraea sp. NPDC048916 TaxID=3154232 RepID=UPI003408D282
MTATRPAPPAALASPARDPVDIAIDACTRFATHLVLLSHQLGEHGLDDGERERLAAALTIVERAMSVTAAAAGSAEQQSVGAS